VDAPLEVADVGLIQGPALTTASIPDTALVETARLQRGYSHKTTEFGQLSLF